MKTGTRRATVLLILGTILILSTLACKSVAISNPGLFLNAAKDRLNELVNPPSKDVNLPGQGSDGTENSESADGNADADGASGQLPEGLVTYYGDVEGVSLEITIDYMASEVTGSLNLSGDDYATAEINGTIDLKTLSVSTTFAGKMGSVTHGLEYPWSGTIEGFVSEDLNTISGILVDSEGSIQECTATR